jgi:CheY-like chemotaxis protein
MSRNSSTAVKHSDTQTNGFEQYHVLLVFSQAHVVRVIKKQLEQFGCRVSSAHDAECALSLIHDNTYSAVLADADLPGTNGVVLCMTIHRQLQQATQDQPLLFLSGITDEELDARHTAWPVNVQCVNWPLNVEALLHSLA